MRWVLPEPDGPVSTSMKFHGSPLCDGPQAVRGEADRLRSNILQRESWMAFVIEEPALERKSAAEARELAVRSDYAMAGDYDRNRIGSIRGAHRTDGIGYTDNA